VPVLYWQQSQLSDVPKFGQQEPLSVPKGRHSGKFPHIPGYFRQFPVPAGGICAINVFERTRVVLVPQIKTLRSEQFCSDRRPISRDVS
jgi:hypothetical protein